MVFDTANDPAYSKPRCDLCSEKIDGTVGLMTFENLSPKGESPGGRQRHEGHLCTDCNPRSEMSFDTWSYKFELVSGEVVFIEINGAAQKSHYRYLPKDAPKPLLDVLDQFIKQTLHEISYSDSSASESS